MFNKLLLRPSSLLLVFLVASLLVCGDIHPNPGPVNSTNLKFCHLNVRGLTSVNDTGARLDHIEQTCCIDDKYDIIAMTESHLGPGVTDDIISISDYQLFRMDRVRGGGGVCCYVKNSIPVSELSQYNIPGLEMMWLKVCLQNQNVFFGVCYRSSSQDALERREFLDNFESVLDRLLSGPCRNSPLILVGDFNDRVQEWATKIVT